MIDHKDIIPLVRVEMSGLNKDTDLGTLEKESGYEIIKNFINEKIKNPFYSDEGLGHMGEDIVFQLKAKEQGFKSLVDTSVVVGHEKTYILR
jgi:hypothetical protein